MYCAPSSHHRFAQDPIRSLPPELRARVYDELRPDEGQALAATSRYYRHHDAELWVQIARPFARVPRNANALWAARVHNRRHPETVEAAEQRDTETLQELSFRCIVLSAMGLVSAMFVSFGLIAATTHIQRDLTPRQAGSLVLGALIGATLGAWHPARRYAAVNKQRLTRRQDAALLPVKTPIFGARTGIPPDEVRTRLLSLQSLRTTMIEALLQGDARPTSEDTSDTAFLADELHLPIDLFAALAARSPAFIERSLAATPRLNVLELMRIVFDARNPTLPYRAGFLRTALEQTPKHLFRDLFRGPKDWKPWVLREIDAPVLDILLERLAPQERASLINDTQPLVPRNATWWEIISSSLTFDDYIALSDDPPMGSRCDSLLHTAIDEGNVAGFLVLLKHGGDLDKPDPFAGITARQFALREPRLRVDARP